MRAGDLVAGRYRLLRPIGAGAMATVWAARHELLGRELALKLATVSDRDDRARRDARDLFLREASIIGKLRHPNVVDIADAGETEGDGLYLAMELLQGESLAQRIKRGALRPASALGIAGEVARGLAAAHAAGVVHRDLKPENVFLACGALGGVVPKLLDFGVSSARGIATLHRGKNFGTPAYMSPEQALGERDIDHRTDVWALGVVLYEMLTGRLPFKAESYPALLPLIIEAPYPPLPASIPAAVRTVVAGCLAKDRSDRYPTADALLEAIERARAAIPATDPTSSRSGFFIEAFPARAAMAAAAVAEATATRTARVGLALSILAVPVAIGIAAVATGIRARKSPPTAAAALTTGEPSAVPPASVSSPAAPADPEPPPPAASATALPASPPKTNPVTSATVRRPRRYAPRYAPR